MSSDIEDRVSRELRDQAVRLVPGELRPLRTPTARTARARVRWLAPAAAMAAVALVAGGLAVAGQLSGPPSPRPSHRTFHPPPHRIVPDPPNIAVAGMPGLKPRNLIKLISARTGRVVQTMSGIGVGDNVALAPDMKSVFTIPPARSGSRIYQVRIKDGTIRYIGNGRWPTPSPDSRLVAYAAGTDGNPHVLAVVSLRTGRTVRLDLSSVIGGYSAVNNPGTLTWLGDGTQLVVLPEPAVYGLANDVPPLHSPPENSCGQQRLKAGLCVVVVTVRPHKLVARPVVVPGWRLQMDQEIISGDLSRRQSFLIARSGSPDGPVDEVGLRRDGVTLRRVASLPRLARPFAIAPDGDRIVYQPNGASTHFSGPVWLWVAPMSGGRLGRPHLLLTASPRFQFDQVSW